MTVIQRLMGIAVPILVWVAMILVIAGLLEYHAIAAPVNLSDETHLAKLFFSAISYSLGNAVWPFGCAALIWTLQNRANGGAE